MADENFDPRRALADQLAADIPTDACVLAYNKGFECRCLKELAEIFPDLSDRLLAIRENVRDLLEVFRHGYVYDRAMGGSFSIKKVLPAIFPDNPRISIITIWRMYITGPRRRIPIWRCAAWKERRAINCGRAFWCIAAWTPLPWSCCGRG